MADEIRKLADSTRETANNIQSINAQVTDAVEKLSDSANQLVTYIDDTIMPDYDSFVKTGEQYRTDATYGSLRGTCKQSERGCPCDETVSRGYFHGD